MRTGHSEDVDWNANPVLDHHITVTSCEPDEVRLRIYEVDDLTYSRLCCDAVGLDDDYGQWSKTPAEWALGSDGSGNGVWSLKTDVNNAFGGTEHRGYFPVRVETTLVSEGGAPVEGGQRRATMLKDEFEKKESDSGGALRGLDEVKAVVPRPGGRRRLHHDDCVTAYYHVESLLAMTKVTYTQPDIVEDFTEPILNFIGESVRGVYVAAANSTTVSNAYFARRRVRVGQGDHPVQRPRAR